MDLMDAIVEKVNIYVCASIENTERALAANRPVGNNLLAPALVAGARSEHVGEDRGDAGTASGIVNYGFEEARRRIDSSRRPRTVVAGVGVTKGWIHDHNIGETGGGGVGKKIGFDDSGKRSAKLEASYRRPDSAAPRRQ